MEKWIKYILVLFVILLAFGLRVYRVGTAIQSVTWDEAAVGYNAYTILHWGRDEWGRVMPLTFKSFEDYKNPIHVYLTIPFIALFGLNETGVRLSAVFFGTLNVFLMYILVRRIFKNDWLGLIAALVLAVSPFNIQFSRFNHELNFAIFFFLLGLIFWHKAFTQEMKNLKYSGLFFGIDLLTYQSAKVIIPPLFIILSLVYLKEILQNKKQFLISLVIFGFFILLHVVHPPLLGGARLNQNRIQPETLKETNSYKKYQSMPLANLEVVSDRYVEYFKPNFLFKSGDPIPRHSSQIIGTFYKLDAIALLFGLVFVIYQIFFKRNKMLLPILIVAFLAPIPGAVSSSFTHAARSMFITGTWHLIIACGYYWMITLFKPKVIRFVISLAIIFVIGKQFINYQIYYYNYFIRNYAIEFQYGIGQVVDYVKENPRYNRVYMTDAHSQPYIFFLFYLKYPLPEFLSTVKYNNTISRPSNLVTEFGKFRFGMWDQINSVPDPNILYVLNPSKYDGLFYRNAFDVVKLVKYPNNTDAFFVVNGYLI